MAELERDAEALLKREVKKRGGLTYKFISPGNSGVPDRIVLLFGRVFFVELKKPKGEPTEVQASVHKDFADQGVKVYVVRGKAEVLQWLEEIESIYG